MQAYLQSSEGQEIELKVQHPDPSDGTVVIPIALHEVVTIWHQATVKEPEAIIWVRIVSDMWDEVK